MLCCPFMDLDEKIEERYGCTVAEIFAERGEAEFRRIEKETLKDILETGGRVVALGGGAVMTPECEEMVHEGTFCVYLRTSVGELVGRLSSETAGRPLLNTTDLRTRILDLMSKRASTYERVSHLVIDTDGKTIDQVASEIATPLPSMR